MSDRDDELALLTGARPLHTGELRRLVSATGVIAVAEDFGSATTWAAIWGAPAAAKTQIIFGGSL